MKKSLIALAALAAVGAASAQSSVTLFGIVDATVQQIRGDGNGSVTRLTSSGYNSSRLGFRGTEDLGGGMSASFWLEAGLNNDDGSMAATNTNNQALPALTTPAAAAALPASGVRAGQQGLTFNRRSTVSLAGGFGEVRLGRDYVPAFWNLTVFDPFGTNGAGSSSNLTIGAGLGTTAAGTGPTTLVTAVRASNSVGYFLPGKLGGFYGQAMYAMGENASNVGVTKSDGKHVGFRLGYAAGPVNVALGYGNTEYAAGDYRVTNIGASYDLGVAKIMGLWTKDQIKAAAVASQTSWVLGATVPVGAGEIRASYVRANVANTSNDANMLAVGYVHNLSKRTAVYTTYARVDNKGTGVGFHNGRATTTGGGNTSALDLGLRHSF